MRLRVAWIQAKPGRDKLAAVTALTNEFVARIARYNPVETRELPHEGALLKDLSAAKARPLVVLLDPEGKEMTSEEFARFLDRKQQLGIQQMWFAVGGADGFTESAQDAADLRLSLGRMTLPHELARVVLLEQIYRAFTILKGHPYHTGH